MTFIWVQKLYTYINPPYLSKIPLKSGIFLILNNPQTPPANEWEIPDFSIEE